MTPDQIEAADRKIGCLAIIAAAAIVFVFVRLAILVLSSP